MPPTILSIQSSVAYGHVGNAAAAFALERLGVEVVRIDTVRFSNHPGHGTTSGGPAPAEEIDALVNGLDEGGFLARCDAVLSGYIGTADNAAATARAVERRRAHGPATYVLDPVMGDHPRGLFVRPDVPDAIRDALLPLADVVVPNAFELEQLTAMPVTHPDQAVVAARTLLGRGPHLVVVTGLDLGGDIQLLAVTTEAVHAVTTPRLDVVSHGAGDAFAALFAGRWLEASDPARALSLAASSVWSLLRATGDLGRDELALVEAQEAIVVPERLFRAERVA